MPYSAAPGAKSQYLSCLCLTSDRKSACAVDVSGKRSRPGIQDRSDERERLDRREGDVSDADWEIYQLLRSTWEPFDADVASLVVPVDANVVPDSVRSAAEEGLRLAGLL